MSMPTRSILMSGLSLSVKRNRRLSRAANVMMVADAQTCAESCVAGITTNFDACIMYILPFVVHRVTWDAWPDMQGRYAVCPPTSWGHCRRECSPSCGRKRTCSQAGVLAKVCRSMFAAVVNYAEPQTTQSMTSSDDV